MPRYGRFGALEYTTAGDGARLAMLVLHDDAKREYAYGQRRIAGHVGRNFLSMRPCTALKN
jgi:hypothetical protein